MRTTRAAIRALAGAAITTTGLALAGPATASAAGFTCEASAVRATVLGQAAEPVTTNRGKACTTTKAGGTDVVPAVANASALTASTTLTGEGAAQAAFAQGGIAKLRVAPLPDLGLGPVLEQVLAPIRAQVAALPAAQTIEIPAVTIPNILGGPPILVTPAQTLATIDVRGAATAALDALARLPTTELLGLDAALASAGVACKDGIATPVGSSQVAGLTVLGQPLPVDEAVERSIKLLDTGSIDLKALFADDGVLGKYVTLGQGIDLSAVQPLLAPVLAALPVIQVPGEALRVKVTPAQQERSGATLTQRSLRVEVAALGRSVLDLVVGEAKVGAEGVACPAGEVAGATANDLALACTTRRLVLVDVLPSGRRVDLFGAADKRLAGRTVDIVFEATGKRVARARVRADGSFRTTAAMPSAAVRGTNRARYRAVLGRERSLNLKLQRRMTINRISSSRGRVRVRGRVIGPLTRPVSAITLKRRVSCRKSEVVKRFKPAADGTFDVVVDAPEGTTAAVYRLETRVQKTVRNPKRFPTFTLPRGVNIVG